MSDALKVQVVTRRLADVRLLKDGRNARFMGYQEMARLTENIRRDGALTSTPLLRTMPDGTEEVLSGNHRVQAAIAALGEDTEATFLLIEGEIDDSRALALQLSHNAIAGEDDPATLKALYDELDDVDLRAYSGLDDKTLELLDDVQPGSLAEANLEYRSMTIVALPEEIDRAKACLKEATTMATGADHACLATLRQFDELLDHLDTAKGAVASMSPAVGLAVVLDVFEAHQTDLAERWDTDEPDERRWVPVTTVFGSRMPAQAGHVARQAITRMLERGDITHPWQALELWAADYMAGA